MAAATTAEVIETPVVETVEVIETPVAEVVDTAEAVVETTPEA